MTTTTNKEPSEEFMTALNELKLVWHDYLHPTNHDSWNLIHKQYSNLLTLARTENLPFRFVDYKLNEITTNCKECNQQITIHRKDEQFCPSCLEKKQKQEWLEECEEERRKEDPIKRYCHKIRGTIPYYERPFIFEPNSPPEELYEDKFKRIMSGDTKDGREEAMREEWTRRKERNSYNDIKNKPEGMTKTEWIKEGRRKRQLQKEEGKQDQLDEKFKYKNSPISMFEDMIDKISCECKGEELRQGTICKTCKLVTKLHQYTLDLFKDAAEGRSTVI